MGNPVREVIIMRLTALVGNTHLKQRLFHVEQGKALSHAYLLCGVDGLGKHTLAREVCAAMVCTGAGEIPCGCCIPCKKVFGGIHPDVITISGESGKPVNVEQIRNMTSDAYVRPNEGERKIYILEQAGEMNASAQNAMLKLLEEGPVYAAFLLLCRQPDQMLQTIRSRCELLQLTPLTTGECEQWLGQNYPQLPQMQIMQTAEDCQGVLGRAVEQLEGGNEVRQRLKQLAEKLIPVLEQGEELELFEATMELDKLSRQEVSAVLEILDGELVKRLPNNGQKSRMLRAVELIRQLQQAALLNVGSGQISGWLCAGMFE